jgi:hypothetical protein
MNVRNTALYFNICKSLRTASKAELRNCPDGYNPLSQCKNRCSNYSGQVLAPAINSLQINNFQA